MLHARYLMLLQGRDIEVTMRYNIGGGGITVSPFTCQVKSTFKENRALTANAVRAFNQSSRTIDGHVVQLQLKIVNNYTWLALS